VSELVGTSSSATHPPSFCPSEDLLGLAGALFSDPAALTPAKVESLLDEAGAITWLNSISADRARAHLGAVYGILLKRALESCKPAWMELFLKRFDPHFARVSAQEAPAQIFAQFTQILSMTESELESFVTVSRRRLQGAVIDVLPG